MDQVEQVGVEENEETGMRVAFWGRASVMAYYNATQCHMIFYK